MLEDNDVSKIVLVNKETAEIFINPDNFSKEMHKDLESKSGLNKNSPHYYYSIGSVEKFENRLENAQINIPDSNKIYLDIETRHNWGGEILSWVFPIALLVGVWFSLCE